MTGAPHDAWRRERWFVAAMLLALASALVPALLASGPPATPLAGSAFDPAASAVALHSREQTLAADAVKDGTDAAAVAPAIPSVGPHDAPPATAPHPAAHALDRPAQRRTTHAQPRAPPLPSVRFRQPSRMP